MATRASQGSQQWDARAIKSQSLGCRGRVELTVATMKSPMCSKARTWPHDTTTADGKALAGPLSADSYRRRDRAPDHSETEPNRARSTTHFFRLEKVE